jgi:hypothetical protein
LWYLKGPLFSTELLPNSKTKYPHYRSYPTPHGASNTFSTNLQRRRLPDVSVDFEEVALLVREADFALFVEACFLQVLGKSTSVSP